ncbi:MAG: lactate utilization protein [Clostridia bacterium]|nr:lactate utilization protein [Clostridia bacterium]
MHQIKKWYYEKVADEIVKILNDKGYDALRAESVQDAKEKILALIPEGSSVAMGGSVTLGEMGLVEIFRTDKYRFFDRYATGSYEECYEVYRQSMLADFLVTGSNAVTRGGEIVNTDSSGNRTAGIIFGPNRVIICVGANKVVDDLPAAFERIKKIAPLNARRIGHRVPCADSGFCEMCELQASVCNATSIIHNGRKHPGRYTVIVIADEVGF